MQGSSSDGFAFARGGGVGAGALHALHVTARRRRRGRRVFVFAAGARRARQPLAIDLPLLAAAQQAGFALGAARWRAAGAPRLPPRTIALAGSIGRGGKRRLAAPGRDRAAGLCPYRPWAWFRPGGILALLFVLAQMLGEGLGAGSAGADGIGGQFEIGLLRSRLGRGRRSRGLGHRGKRRQLDRAAARYRRAGRLFAVGGLFLELRSIVVADRTGTLSLAEPGRCSLRAAKRRSGRLARSWPWSAGAVVGAAARLPGAAAFEPPAI